MTKEAQNDKKAQNDTSKSPIVIRFRFFCGIFSACMPYSGIGYPSVCVCGKKSKIGSVYIRVFQFVKNLCAFVAALCYDRDKIYHVKILR